MALQRRQAQMVRNGASSNKIDYIAQILGILNPKGYLNCVIDSKVTAVLLNGRILPTRGVA